MKGNLIWAAHGQIKKESCEVTAIGFVRQKTIVCVEIVHKHKQKLALTGEGLDGGKFVEMPVPPTNVSTNSGLNDPESLSRDANVTPFVESDTITNLRRESMPMPFAKAAVTSISFQENGSAQPNEPT